MYLDTLFIIYDPSCSCGLLSIQSILSINIAFADGAFTLQQVALQDFAHVSGRGSNRTLKGSEPVGFQASCSPRDRPYQAVYRHRRGFSAFR